MYTILLRCHLRFHYDSVFWLLRFHYDSVCGFSWAVAIHSVLFLHLCGANLVMFLIREGFVGGFGGGKKAFILEMQIEKY